MILVFHTRTLASARRVVSLTPGTKALQDRLPNQQLHLTIKRWSAEMKNVSNQFMVYMMGFALALGLAVTTVAGQGGDPRNPKPSPTPNSSSTPETTASRKPMTKAGVVKARLVELINLCKAGRYSKVTSYVRPKSEESTCSRVKANTKNGYYFGKFVTQTSDGVEVVAWEVYYRAPDTKGEIYFFKLLNGKYVLVDIDPIRQSDQ